MTTTQLRWTRKCQECGYTGFYHKPNLEDKKEAWRDTKCRKCKSEALDFGQEEKQINTMQQDSEGGE